MKNTESLATSAIDETQDTLELVKDVADIRRIVNDLYVRTIRKAHEDGHTLQACGDAAGTGRSNIHTLIKGRAA
jgi:hypothetical protein